MVVCKPIKNENISKCWFFQWPRLSSLHCKYLYMLQCRNIYMCLVQREDKECQLLLHSEEPVHVHVTLYMVDWPKHVCICLYITVRSHISGAQDRLLLLQEALSRQDFQVLSTSHQPHPSCEGTICTYCRLVYQMLLW